MFRRLRAVNAGLSVTIDGEPVTARAGASVATTMLAAGHEQCRATARVDGQRAAHCTAAACFDCLVTVDGIGNRQGCLVEVRSGMRIETQHGRRKEY